MPVFFQIQVEENVKFMGKYLFGCKIKKFSLNYDDKVPIDYISKFIADTKQKYT